MKTMKVCVTLTLPVACDVIVSWDEYEDTADIQEIEIAAIQNVSICDVDERDFAAIDDAARAKLAADHESD